MCRRESYGGGRNAPRRPQTLEFIFFAARLASQPCLALASGEPAGPVLPGLGGAGMPASPQPSSIMDWEAP